MTRPLQHRLSELIAGLTQSVSTDDPYIQGISADSRRIQPGWLFIAAPGGQVDGRDYISDAATRGAAAVVYEHSAHKQEWPPAALTVPRLAVVNLKQNIGLIADRFFNSPSRALRVVGVTGTNGKTTCTHLLAQALDAPSERCALIGTLGTGFPGALDISLHTTPDAVRVHELMAEFLRTGATTVCMEVSSHALDQGRVNGVAFDIAVLTNLTQDHLDYHQTMEAYAQAKARLFHMDGLGTAVLNVDDALGQRLAHSLAGKLKIVTYGFQAADILAHDLQLTPQGMTLKVKTPVGDALLKSPLLGQFNAANLLAALAVLLVLGMSLEQAVTSLGKAQPVAGRMERFGGHGQPLVVVDYAHTPDALEKVLQALRAHVRGRLWCVFGCGGNRDRTKRPQMGRLAEALADVVILTDDNPRHESADQIIVDILSGMRTKPHIERDRALAIRHAIHAAQREDTVLVAGKGHEDYQLIGDQRLPFSDRQVVRACLEEAA